MRIRNEVRFGVGALLAIQILTMIAAVALLARMSPAIGQVLEDNEKSIRAVERMLMALASPPAEAKQGDLRRLQFERALAEAAGNITDPREAPVLERIEGQHEAALAGDPAALAILRTDLWELSDINRDSMLQANDRAKQLGTAGAWALVFLGLIGLLFSMGLLRRARVKLINPVYELGSVLQACSKGDGHRRFSPGRASRDFQEVAEVVNALVSEHFTRRERDWETVAKLDRVALLRLLDREGDPTVVCKPDGAIAAANEAALELLSGATGADIRADLAQVCRAGAVVEGISVEPLHDAGLLCRLRPQRRSVSSISLELDGVPGVPGVPGSTSAPVSLASEPAGSAPSPGSGLASEPAGSASGPGAASGPGSGAASGDASV